jgi:phenylpyruvate tautomerase PptA (4-oxalocrotonate tautomerase family)
MKTFYVTVEGLVERVHRVQANNVAEAVTEAKKEFIATVGALNAEVTAANEENTNG